MAIIKCKMCGGDLELVPDSTVCECEYCGTRQTVPSADSEKMLSLFHRAGKLLRACEFDKAYGVYESIVAEFPDEAEAYWGLVLCKFGIEYVDDPATGKKVSTCHRAGFESVEDDANFEQACENADAVARRVYREEGRAIDALRERIIEVSGREEPYDIFISYKELAEDGERTEDSVLAQDIYDALTAKGYRVFFSRITLEDKLGVEYEPYIFAALNSAKVMLLVGMDYENLNAVWVKNEWSRYLALMTQHKDKVLIPCYKDMDPYDLPKEVRKLAAQDMGKVGAMQDLLRGVEKILPLKKAEPASAAAQSAFSQVDAYIDRGMMFLEDEDFVSADSYFERALDQNPRAGKAYLGKLLAQLRLIMPELLAETAFDAANSKHYARAMQYLSEPEAAVLRGYGEKAQRKYELVRLKVVLKKATKVLESREIEQKRQEQENAAAAAQAAIREKLPALRARIAPAQGMVVTTEYHTVALCADGSVLAAGRNGADMCDVSDWKDIVAIAAANDRTVGLKADGTVVAVGRNGDGQCNVSDWKDMVAIAVGSFHTVGLRADGTVAAVGENEHDESHNYRVERVWDGRCSVSLWENIKAIAAGYRHTVGLKADGTVVAAGVNQDGQCNVFEWKDIVAIAAGRDFTVGLKSDGSFVSTRGYFKDQKNACALTPTESSNILVLQNDGTVCTAYDRDNFYGQLNVSEWREIIALATGDFSLGLKADGTVIGAGTKHYDQYRERRNHITCDWDLSHWENIVAISVAKSTYYGHAVGLREDGTLVTAGHPSEALDVLEWKLFENLDTLEVERGKLIERGKAQRKAAAEKAEAERKAKLASLETEQAALSEELNNLKGLFTGKRRKEIEARLAEIDSELKILDAE